MSLLDNLKKGKTKEIAIPDSDQKVRIRSLSMKEMREYEKAREAADADHAALLIGVMILAVVGDQGNQVWQSSDADALQDVPFSAIKFITTEVAKYSGIEPAKNG